MMGKTASQKPGDATLATTAGKLTRSQVAARLGVSVTTLRRMEGVTVFPEIGPRGVRLFHPSSLADVAVRQGSASRVCGDAAAEIFRAFDEGDHPVDLVIRFRLEPDVVEALYNQWARLRSILVIDPGVRKMIEEEISGDDWRGQWTFSDAAELFEGLREALRPVPCLRCKKGMAVVCRSCFRNR